MWPLQKLVRFRVVTPFQISGAAGAITVGTLKANSLNDPTGFASAAYPLGFKEWAAMYKSYCVVGSRCLLRTHATAATGAVMYGINLLNTATTLTSYSHYQELPMTKARMLSADLDHSGLGLSYSAKKFWKIRKFKDAEQQHGTMAVTPSATDPTDIAYYHIWVQDTYGTDTATVEGTLTMEFVCLLFDPTTPSRSV